MSVSIIVLVKLVAAILSAGLLYRGFSSAQQGRLLTKIAGIIVTVCTLAAVIPDIWHFSTSAEASPTEQKFWEGVLKYREEHKNNLMDCAYLKKYPDGQFVVLAKAECPDTAVEEAQPSVAKVTQSSVATQTHQIFEPEMVQLPDGSWMGKYEVTISEYLQCVNDGGCYNPEWLQESSQYNINTGSDRYYAKTGMSLNNKRYPITGVSWDDTQKYITWLNRKTNKTYRLPTEQEWFKACQADKKTEYCGSNNLEEVAWYPSNSNNTAHEIGTKTSNGWGLYDMSGNVWEWTSSFYSDKNTDRVICGGSWDFDPSRLRPLTRINSTPSTRDYDLGFRLVRM